MLLIICTVFNKKDDIYNHKGYVLWNLIPNLNFNNNYLLLKTFDGKTCKMVTVLHRKSLFIFFFDQNFEKSNFCEFYSVC